MAIDYLLSISTLFPKKLLPEEFNWKIVTKIYRRTVLSAEFIIPIFLFSILITVNSRPHCGTEFFTFILKFSL